MSRSYAQLIAILLAFLCLSGPLSAEPASISGRVTYQGEPVSGVRVFVDHPWEGAQVSATGPSYHKVTSRLAVATTDEAGHYSLRLYEDSMVYHRELQVHEGETVSDQDFSLYVPHEVRGTVLWPDGQPAAGVKVMTSTSRWLPEGTEYITSQTDAEGGFVFGPAEMKSMPCAPWLVMARVVEPELIGASIAETWADTPQIRLARATHLVGKVFNGGGQPVVGMGVDVTTSRKGRAFLLCRAKSDEQGSLRMGPLPADVRLCVTCEYERRKFVLDDYWPFVHYHTLAPGEEYEMPTMHANPKGRTVRGWIGNEDLQGVPGALVFGTETDEIACADDEGFFEISKLPARSQVWLVAVHPVESLAAFVVLDPDWGFEPGMILHPTANAMGVVVDEQGKPVSGATLFVIMSPGIRASSLLPSGLGRHLRAGAGHLWKTMTDEHGRWRVERLISGMDYDAYALVHEGSRRSEQIEFSIQPGATVDVGEIVMKQKQ